MNNLEEVVDGIIRERKLSQRMVWGILFSYPDSLGVCCSPQLKSTAKALLRRGATPDEQDPTMVLLDWGLTLVVVREADAAFDDISDEVPKERLLVLKEEE